MSDDNPTLPYPNTSVEHPTLVIPDDVRGEARKKRRPRWPWVLAIVVVLLVALVVAAEFIARSVLPGIVRGIVIEQMDLPADQQLDVVADGVLLPQLIGGRLDSLHLSTEQVTVGGITGAVDVSAQGVPLRGGDLDSASGTVRIAEDQFTALLDGAELPIDTVALEEPDVTVSGSVPVFGISIPIALRVTPSADGGELILTPVNAQIGGVTVEADGIADQFGSIGDRLTEPQRLCIADQLPAGLTLTGLEVVGDAAVADFDVDGAIVTDEALQENGVCP